MLISWVVLIIAIVGLLVWALAANPKASEAGRLMFFAGLLVCCLSLAGKVIRLG